MKYLLQLIALLKTCFVHCLVTQYSMDIGLQSWHCGDFVHALLLCSGFLGQGKASKNHFFFTTITRLLTQSVGCPFTASTFSLPKNFRMSSICCLDDSDHCAISSACLESRMLCSFNESSVKPNTNLS